MPASASLRLGYTGFRVRARGEAADLAWLAEFLAPWFRPAPGPGGEAVVALRRAGGRHAALLPPPPAAPAPATPVIDVFVLDSRVVRHPVVEERGAERLVRDDELRVLYRLSRRHPHVRVLAGTDRVGARVALMRVVRELAMLHARRAGHLLFHAAALAAGGRGIALLGDKHAGKTTLLLHLLRVPGTRFVANDRTLVTRDGSGGRLVGLPSIVALRPGTLAFFPELRRRLAERRSAFWRTRTEAWLAGPGGPAGAGADVTPAQLCEAAGVDAAVDAPLAALVFPRIDGAARGLVVERLPAAVTAGRLRDGRFGGRAWDRGSTALGGPRASVGPDTAALAEACDALARCTPAFECRIGPDAYAAPATAATLLERVATPG
jgi:hypothetical protein